MTNFGAFFLLESKRFFRKRNAIILLMLFTILTAFTIVGIYEYKDTVDRQQKFREIEALNFKKFPNYDIYGDEGISVQYCPSPVSIFFRNIGISTELIGKFDSHVNISIFDNYKSRSLFRDMFSGIWSFAGIIFVFVSLLCLFWGAEFMSGTEYLKFLSTILSNLRVFFLLLLSRIIIITLLLMFIFISMYVLLAAFGIHLASADLGNLKSYFFDTLMMLFFFFLLGLIIGMLRSKTGGVLAILVVWILFIFLIPGFIRNIVENKTFGSIKDYQMEIEKFRKIFDFEKGANEEYGSKFNRNNMELARAIMENYFAKDYPHIESLEMELKKGIDKNIGIFGKLSLVTPSSIYYNTSIEVSSLGYESFSNFYMQLVDLKKRFVRFYIDRFYYHDPNEMVNFIKDAENLYFAQSRLPHNYGKGLFVNLLYFFVLVFLSYFCFKKSLYRVDEKDMERFFSSGLEFRKGELNVLKVKDENLKNILYRLFSGGFKSKKFCHYPGRVMVNGEEISNESAGIDFLYIPNGSAIPGDIKVNDFIALVASLVKVPGEEKTTLINASIVDTLGDKKFSQVEKHKKAEIILAASLIKKSSTYFFFDTALGLSEDFAIPFKEKMETLKQEAVVIYFTGNISIDISICEENTGNYLVEDRNWAKMVDHLKNLRKEKKDG